MKLKTIYLCTQCQSQSSRWSGQCSSCGEWNTLVEETVNVGKAEKSLKIALPALKPVVLSDVLEEKARLKTGMGELDRVLGGGFVEDGLVLLTGAPGIGKSTLTLQIGQAMAKLRRNVLYISGEESVGQIAARARRLGIQDSMAVVNLNHLESILAVLESSAPGFIVIDSVQVMASEEVESQAGSISQVRTVAEELMKVAKGKGVPVLLIGHVNKEGQLAGPQVLTHLVDAVLYLEGDSSSQFRLLRSTKNRFGTVDEVGVFTMEESGLQEVKNPSALFLEGRSEMPIGSAIVPVLEGTRVFLVEVQALMSHTNFGYPKRTASGFDLNRLNIILAVLGRYAQMNLDSSDVYVNVVGGLKLKEPAADLAVALAIVSSKLKKPLPANLVAIGEMGLSGEIRSVSFADRRMKEAKKLGFSQVATAPIKVEKSLGVELIEDRSVAGVLGKVFGGKKDAIEF